MGNHAYSELDNLLSQVISAEDWERNHTLTLNGREAQYYALKEQRETPALRACLARLAGRGLYRHQLDAIREALAGNDVCLTTSTASGKSLVFYASAIQLIATTPAARVLALYPLKALAREQEDRWRDALHAAGLNVRVGRIDGQVPTSLRSDIVKESQVLIATPDILHAWMLASLTNKTIRAFFSALALVIVDEVHSYSGVFGSNAAFLNRRLQHVLSLFGSRPQYICASATIADAPSHLSKLFGRSFWIVDETSDTSPKYPISIHLLNPTGATDLLTGITKLLRQLSRSRDTRFIAFLDSRKQVEYATSILSRPTSESEGDGDDLEYGLRSTHDLLSRLDIMPFRSGYEEADREAIQARLTSGHLSGVVSTSALELGMDIPSLSVAVLVGVPHSATSLHQRIGRIGRHGPGAVLIINTGDVYDQAVFDKPQSLLSRPPAEGALYLENTRIQYIHALCLARQNGEHDQACVGASATDMPSFSSPIEWPDGFIELCRQERLGLVPLELQSMKHEAGDDPNHVFPLRDVESQFSVELKQGPEQRRLGSLSYSQLLREAYPGGIYYYLTEAFRVYSIYVPAKQVAVRREKRYTTKPSLMPTQVFPNLGSGNLFRGIRYGELIAVECAVQIREQVTGYRERRGPNEIVATYPLLASATGIKFALPRFARNYFTTGVVITHPCLSGEGVKVDSLAAVLFEAFLIEVPLERQDVNLAADKHRASQGPISKGQAFCAVYDQVYGSLRLSGRLLDGATLQAVLSQAQLLSESQLLLPNEQTGLALQELLRSVKSRPESFTIADPGQIIADESAGVSVIMPGSKGWAIFLGNEEFTVEAVYYHPAISGLAYRGRRASNLDPANKEILSIDAIAPIPGESIVGTYNPTTGEISLR